MSGPPYSNLPRILFLASEAPHTEAAGSIVFHRLFSEYPIDRLRVVTNHLPPSTASRLPCQYAFLPLAADRLVRTRFWPWRAALRALGASDMVRLSQIDRLVEDFKPDLVATLMQDCWYYDLAARYAKARQLPLALFVHDLPDGFEPVPLWLKAKQNTRDKSIYQQAAVRLCVSSPMAGHFERAFGAPSEVLLPPRSDSTPSQNPECCRQLKNDDHLTLGYSGGLHYGYGEQLLAMLPVLRETKTVVEIFGPEPSGILLTLRNARDVFHFNGFAETPEVAARGLLDKCDALLLPYLNPPGPHAHQYLTHFPSKLGDYLTLGLPLFVTGPETASGVAWCKEHKCAFIASKTAPASLKNALLELRQNHNLRIELARAAQSQKSLFDRGPLVEKMYAALRKALIKAAPESVAAHT